MSGFLIKSWDFQLKRLADTASLMVAVLNERDLRLFARALRDTKVRIHGGTIRPPRPTRPRPTGPDEAHSRRSRIKRKLGRRVLQQRFIFTPARIGVVYTRTAH